MISVGVLYSLYNKLPSFSTFSSFKSGNEVKEVLSAIEDKWSFKIDDSLKDTPFLAIKFIEDRFLEKFKEAVGNDAFFSTLISLKTVMPKVRLSLREAILQEKSLKDAFETLRTQLAESKGLIKLLEEYISEKNNKYLKISELEKDIDSIQLKLLESSIAIDKSIYKKYLSLLKTSFEEDSKLRSFYGISETADGKDAERTEKFKKLKEMECRFVNKATTEFSEELVALQCFVTYNYLFYNARVIASVSKAEREAILVNYNIS